MTMKATPSFKSQGTTCPVTWCHTSEDQTTKLLLLNHMFGPGEIGHQQEKFSSLPVNFETDLQTKLPISFQKAKIFLYDGQYFKHKNHCH